MPIVSASEKWCSAGPPKKNIESVMASVDVCVITVREIVAVMAELMTSTVEVRRILRKCSRTRSKIITDSFTE